MHPNSKENHCIKKALHYQPFRPHLCWKIVINSSFILQASLCSKLCFDQYTHTQKPSCPLLHIPQLLQCRVKFLFCFQLKFLSIHICSISAAKMLEDRACTFAFTASMWTVLLSASLVNNPLIPARKAAVFSWPMPGISPVFFSCQTKNIKL